MPLIVYMEINNGAKRREKEETECGLRMLQLELQILGSAPRWVHLGAGSQDGESTLPLTCMWLEFGSPSAVSWDSPFALRIAGGVLDGVGEGKES